MVHRPIQPGHGLLALSAFASGFSSLALELLWGRELALTFGSSQYAVAAVLTSFMIGLGIGAAAGGWLADRLARPAAAVVVIEAGLAVIGPLWAFGLLRLPSVAATVLPSATDASKLPFLAGRLLLGVALLLLPTSLMGAGFPLLARALGSSLTGLHRGIGVLVASATIGGVVGAAATGFLLLPGGGIPAAVAAASLANLVAAAAAARGQRHLGDVGPSNSPTPSGSVLDATSCRLLGIAAVSGATVLAAETIWHRALVVVVANSTATLTVLLAVTLTGLGLGAAVSTPWLSRPRPLVRWGALQLTAAAVLIAQALLLPHLADLARFIRPASGWERVLIPPVVVGGSVILPATLLLGAAWPLLLAAATPRVEDGGRRLGLMATVNSVGAGIGAAVTGFFVLPALGFGKSLLLVAGCHAGLAAAGRGKRSGWLYRTSWIVALGLVAVAVLGPRFAAVPLPSIVADPTVEILQYRESPAGTVVVTEDSTTGGRSMFVDNNAVIGSTYDAVKIVRMLGLVPGLLHTNPKAVLVIGYGAGVTCSTIAAVPGIEHVDVAEIVPEVVRAATYFDELNHGVDRDPRVRMFANDGRNALLLGEQRYDVITCDPVHPLYGSAPLYSSDFFELCRGRLRENGIVCQYLPLHRMPSREFRRAIATFADVFANTWVLFGLGHAMLVGGDTAVSLDWHRWQDTLRRFQHPDDLAGSCLSTPAQIAALLQLDPVATRSVAQGPPSTDLRPYLEFLAPDAYRSGLWAANARILVEAYRSPVGQIDGLPPELAGDIRRLVAGKRLLLFSLLERNDGNREGTVRWLQQALTVAGDDPEIQLYARQIRSELERGTSSSTGR